MYDLEWRKGSRKPKDSISGKRLVWQSFVLQLNIYSPTISAFLGRVFCSIMSVSHHQRRKDAEARQTDNVVRRSSSLVNVYGKYSCCCCRYCKTFNWVIVYLLKQDLPSPVLHPSLPPPKTLAHRPFSTCQHITYPCCLVAVLRLLLTSFTVYLCRSFTWIFITIEHSYPFHYTPRDIVLGVLHSADNSSQLASNYSWCCSERSWPSSSLTNIPLPCYQSALQLPRFCPTDGNRQSWFLMFHFLFFLLLAHTITLKFHCSIFSFFPDSPFCAPFPYFVSFSRVFVAYFTALYIAEKFSSLLLYCSWFGRISLFVYESRCFCSCSCFGRCCVLLLCRCRPLSAITSLVISINCWRRRWRRCLPSLGCFSFDQLPLLVMVNKLLLRLLVCCHISSLSSSVSCPP